MKIKIDNYSFDKTAKTVTFTDYTTIRLDGILLITNATDSTSIFNFADPTKGGVVSGNILTLAYDTSAMNNADKLLIYYEDTTDEVALASKQDDIIDEISNKDVMVAVKALLNVIANPSYVDKSTNQMRAVVTGTVTSSTTIAVSDITLKGTYQPRVEVIANNLSAWSTVVRNRIT